MVTVDVVELLLREALLPGGGRVEPEPEDQPRKAGSTGDDEGHLPAQLVAEVNEAPRDEERRDHRADVGAAVEDARGQRALPFREPFRHGLDRSWKHPRFADAKQATDNHMGDTQASNECVDNPKHGPNDEGKGEAQPGADLIDDPPCKNRHAGVEGREGRGDIRVVGVSPAETAGAFRRAEELLEITDDLTVCIIDRRNGEEQGADHPAVPAAVMVLVEIHENRLE